MTETPVSRLNGVRSRQFVAAVLIGAVAAQLLVGATNGHAQQVQLNQMIAAFGSVPVNTAYAMGPRGQVQIAVGVNGSQAVLPIGPNGIAFSKQFGLQMAVDSAWPGQYGYRPIDVSFLADKPATRDLRISFRFSAGDYRSNGHAITVEQSTILKQGETTAAMQVIVPQLDHWQQSGWEVTVNGQRDEDLTVNQLDFYNVVGRGAAPGMGVVGTMLDGRQWAGLSNELQTAFSSSNVTLQRIDPADLPSDWLEYSMLDVFVVPADKFAEFLEQYPIQADAMMRWVATGGNLWLLESGRGWQELPSIEGALTKFSLPAGGRSRSSALADEEEINLGELPTAWSYAPLGNRSTEPSEGALELSGFEVAPPSTPAPSAATAPAATPPAVIMPRTSNRRRQSAATPMGAPASNNAVAPDSRDWFAVRGWGLGAITAFRDDFDGRAVRSDLMYPAISQSLLAPRLQWPNRFGNHPDNSNSDFNNWLIPNVGVAPVGQFQFLITIFVLVIGPLNYWLLKRSNRLPMLLATVPAAAVLTTLLLFAYGMLADGFGVRMRGRSVTLLDQRAGEAVSWGRLSYYAGIAPRNGLAVPVDQAMYPINPNWTPNFGYGRRYGNGAGAQREVVWNDKQRLTRGWLASRTPTQYQVVAARPSKKRLELRPTPEGMRVVNRLGTDISLLAIHAKNGKFYFCENLAKDEGRLLLAVDQSELGSRVRRRFTENIPEAPGGDDARYRSNAYGFPLSQSTMEGRLEAINSPAVTGWGPGRYIAFTAAAIELDPGLPDVEEEASFHVVEGSW